MLTTHCYLFAHIFLRNILAKNTNSVIKNLLREKDDYLLKIWKIAGESLTDDLKSKPTGLSLTTAGTADAQLFVITLPPPQKPSEAYFIAIFLNRNIETDSANTSNVRYITLEMAEKIGDTTPCFLCEWSGENYSDHSNYGLTPTMKLEDFVETVQLLVSESHEENDNRVKFTSFKEASEYSKHLAIETNSDVTVRREGAGWCVDV